jgi:hypothetical protein
LSQRSRGAEEPLEVGTLGQRHHRAVAFAQLPPPDDRWFACTGFAETSTLPKLVVA